MGLQSGTFLDRVEQKKVCVVMRLFGLILLGFMMLGQGVVAQSMSKETSLNLSRYDQMLDRVMKQNEQLMADMRALERTMGVVKGDMQKATDKVFRVSDDQQELSNTVLQDQGMGLKQLNGRMAKVESMLAEVWGSGQRDCAILGVKHQQVKVTSRPDGSRTVRLLCYDGKPLHLGTEVYDPARE